MRKIKFKTEYVPLSDDAINRHKNFDQLMAMYVTMPKPNWFRRFIHKKGSMFGGGLMTGAIVTSLLWYNYQHTQTITTASQQTVIAEQPESVNDPAMVVVDTSGKVEKPQPDVKKTEQSAKENTNLNSISNGIAEGLEEKKPVYSPQQDKTTDAVKEKPAVAIVVQNENKIQAADHKEVTTDDKSALLSDEKQESTASEQDDEEEPHPDEIEAVAIKAEAVGLIIRDTIKENSIYSEETATESKVADEQTNSHNTVVIGPPVLPEEETSSNQLSDTEKSKQEKVVVPIVIPPLVAANTPPENKNLKKSNDKKSSVKKDKEDVKDSDKEKSTSDSSKNVLFGGLKVHLFDRDSTKEGGSKKGLFAFLKDTSGAQRSDTPFAVDTGNFLKRYAQVSFITPLSSNGIDGYKYMHYISLNVLQGYNGAVEGVEFGGLLNGDKGYVTGAQFGGLGNYTGGRLKGAQFGGLANLSASVTGAQFAGLTNVSGSFVSGFQAAGIVNIVPDSLNGVQVAGVVNILSSEKKARMGQIAAVGNMSLADSRGFQIAGVFNLADKHDGVQIGLINVGKNIKGLQIGLINISDTISGFPIGLISVSKHGVFDVNGWTSDFLTFNGAIRVGSPYIYNIYAYGVSPFNNELPFGFGIGIGGHIPIKRAFLDIDGMAWTMHRSYMSFNGINMINQLRVMGGFTIHKYISVFAGPTFNVGVQDNRYDPFHSNSFYEDTGYNTTVYMWPGFVAGIRVF